MYVLPNHFWAPKTQSQFVGNAGTFLIHTHTNKGYLYPAHSLCISFYFHSALIPCKYSLDHSFKRHPTAIIKWLSNATDFSIFFFALFFLHQIGAKNAGICSSEFLHFCCARRRIFLSSLCSHGHFDVRVMDVDFGPSLKKKTKHTK